MRTQASDPWLVHVLLLAALAVAMYANSLGNGFVGDDRDQLLRNPVVTGHDLGAAFGSGVWAFRGAQTNYYRPAQFVVYIVLHGLFGPHAFGFHLFFVLLHAANTILVYFLTARLSGRARTALAAAALFAVHPIHTEVVDWIASLPDLMVTALAVFGVWSFARQGGSPRGRQIVCHGALYLAALLTKETGVMLLPLYLAYDRVLLRRPWRRNAALYGGMMGVLAVYLAGRWMALGGLAPGQQTFHRLTPLEFGLSAVVITAQYLGRLIFPGDLNYFHVFHVTGGLTPGLAIAAVALMAVAAAGFARPTAPVVRYGILWIALTLLPALNLTGVGQNVFAERYLYLPSVGFCWIAGLAWDWCAGRRARAAWAVGISILCAAAWQTMARNPDWRDDYTLLRVTVAQSPDAGILHNNLAGAYVDRDDLEHALTEEREAVRLEPRSAPFHKNLGLLLMAHDPRAAIAEFEEALRLQPGDASLPELLREARAAANR